MILLGHTQSTTLRDMENKLVTWIKKELDARNWSIRFLAKKSGVSHAYVAEVLKGDKDVNWYFCVATAKGFNEPVWKFFVMAGLIDEVPPETIQDEETRLMVKIFNDLPPRGQEEALSYLKWLATRYENPL